MQDQSGMAGSIYHATNCSLLILLFLKLHLIEELEEEGMRKELCVPLSIGGATIVWLFSSF